LYTQKSLSHRRENLDFIRGSLHISRQFFLDQSDHNADDHIGVVSFQEEKVSAFIVKNYRNPLIDLMGVYHNITLRSLPENLYQFYNGKTAGGNNIFQHTSRSYAGKLIHISHQDQAGTGNYR